MGSNYLFLLPSLFLCSAWVVFAFRSNNQISLPSKKWICLEDLGIGWLNETFKAPQKIDRNFAILGILLKKMKSFLRVSENTNCELTVI